MQCISLEGLHTLLSEGAFVPLQSNPAPKLSRMTAILLMFQADSEHKRIINVYVGLVVCRVDCHLYSPNQINDFIQDIDVDLRAVHGALKAGCDAGKRCTYCLFMDNLSSVMSIPTDPRYCLVYPTTYIKGTEPDHFDTRNSPTGMCLHHCVCQATLQLSDTDPQQCTKYRGSCLIVPCRVQYKDRLFPSIVEPWNHRGPLIDPVTGETCPMEVVGDFRATDPIFKGSYGDSFLYSDNDLVQKVYLPIFQEEIPVPPVPSYQQSREPVAAKQSPHRNAAPNTAAGSPKTRRSSSKAGAPQGSGQSSKTSTPKCPDSTLAKTPPHPQESTQDCPAKSPLARSSRKHGHSPSLSMESTENKQIVLSVMGSGTVDTTLPICSSTFLSPTGSLSKVVDPLAPPITSTPLGKVGHREGQTISSNSRMSSTLLFTSSSFNIPGLPSVGLGSLTPLLPSIAGSHHISNTWPLDTVSSGASAPCLTVDQATSLFGLASECQVLGIRFAKGFQMLSGLEAIHRNSVQGMAHETLTLGHSARKATYVAILWDNVTDAEFEATMCHLHSEADAAWKKMHEVMYNHQLEYDRQLSDFLKEAEATLAKMRDLIWTAIHALVEGEGMNFEDCLNLTLRILPLLLHVPMDVSYKMQIPLIIAYCLESSIYRRWDTDHGRVSPFCKEVQASRTLTKVLGGIHRKNSEGADRSLSPAASKASEGSSRSRGSRAQLSSHSGSITSHCSHQLGSAYSWTTKDDDESISGSEPSHAKEDAPHDDEHAEIHEGDSEVLGNGQVASNGEDGLGGSPTQNTHLGVSHIFGTHEETDGESIHEEGIPTKRQKWCQPSPKEETSSHESEESSSSEEEQLTDEALHDRCRQWASVWTLTLMPGSARRSPKAFPAGPLEIP